MKKENIGTALVLQKLNCSSIDSFNQRIILQKKVYLAQAYGAKLGHRYSWYIHGPYSKDLTSVAYEIIPQDAEDFSGYKLKNSVVDILDKVNGLESMKPDTLTVTSWYELVASLIFLRDEYGIWGLKGKSDVVEKLKESKPWYQDAQIDEAWAICESINDGPKV